MLELTNKDCEVLEKQALEKLGAVSSDRERILDAFYQAAVRATIVTIREYERMKQSPPSAPPAEL